MAGETKSEQRATGYGPKRAPAEFAEKRAEHTHTHPRLSSVAKRRCRKAAARAALTTRIMAHTPIAAGAPSVEGEPRTPGSGAVSKPNTGRCRAIKKRQSAVDHAVRLDDHWMLQ
jgi:hypothetical protein